MVAARPEVPPALARSLAGRAQRLFAAGLVGVACGLASALFLWLLAVVTEAREAHAALVWALPVAGLAMGTIAARSGRSVRTGTNLVLATLADLEADPAPAPTTNVALAATGLEGRAPAAPPTPAVPPIPFRLAPLVLLGTIVTHLFGGSAGREGTAVQMGGALAEPIARLLRLGREARRTAILCGISGGFGSVFGTPVAGALFALEVTRRKRLEASALLPAAVAAVVGDLVTRRLGIEHAPYPVAAPLALGPAVLGKWLAFAALVALVARGFVVVTHGVRRLAERLPIEARPLLGGAAVLLLAKLLGTTDFLGLGLPTIARAFHDPTLPVWTFAAKVVFTALTVGSGFVGGEVTPLFFVGATLGNVAARGLGLPLDMAALVGMAAIFGAASKTPIALTIMAVELGGGGVLPHALLVALVATRLAGAHTIYMAPPVRRT